MKYLIFVLLSVAFTSFTIQQSSNYQVILKRQTLDNNGHVHLIPVDFTLLLGSDPQRSDNGIVSISPAVYNTFQNKHVKILFAVKGVHTPHILRDTTTVLADLTKRPFIFEIQKTQ